jgi:hypothetical protein
MLQQALIVAWNEENGKKDKSKIPALFVKNQITNIKNKTPHKLQFLGLVSLFTAQLSDCVIAFNVHSFVVYDYDEGSSFTNIQALVTDTHLYGSLAPESLLQILQLVQGQMVKSHCIHVGPATNVPTQTFLAIQYLGFVTSSSCKTDDELEVNLNCIDVLKLSKSTNRMLWGKFGFSINFPGQVTDDKVYYPLQKFTNKIVSDMLLQEIDQEPSIGVSVDIEHWMNEPIDFFSEN